jgi:hypothetical protein
VKIVIFTQNRRRLQHCIVTADRRISAVESISTLLLLFLFTGGGFLKAPMSANGAAHMSLKAASNLLHFSIETVDANHDGSTDSVIHFDPSNSVTLLGVANLTAHDFLFL